ncbi:hypothetical protein ZTR_08924 [Talaromyces verruculosus]|nr:hypothetical protein ZTR_08924 [Talaromyces verruculosus]
MEHLQCSTLFKMAQTLQVAFMDSESEIGRLDSFMDAVLSSSPNIVLTSAANAFTSTFVPCNVQKASVTYVRIGAFSALTSAMEVAWENTNSEVVEFLHDELPFQWPWGFTIYRTVYTSESDQYWGTVLEAISKVVMKRLDEDEPSRIFQEGYRPLVFDDPAEFNEATLDKIRDHFREVQESDNGNAGVRFRWCLVIDDGALQSILRHPEPKSGQKGGWVTVVDPNYQRGSSYNTRYYPGYFRLYLGYLWSLMGIGRALELDELCGRMDGPDDIPWFDTDM